MATFEEKLIEAVRRKREAAGLSIRGLSAEVSISFSTLARIERGEGQPDNNSKIRLLEWLGPDAEKAGLGFDSVALVHFRAGKNIRSGTVQSLLRAAYTIRAAFSGNSEVTDHPEPEEGVTTILPRSKDELEEIADKFRRDLDLRPDDALDSLQLEVDGVSVVKISDADMVEPLLAKRLRFQAGNEWSAMSIPLDPGNDRWAVLLNDDHAVERQRVTILEEYWHIFLGHKLTKVARVADAYGRTYDQSEEHDAYYLASASLLPKKALYKAVSDGASSEKLAKRFGTSPELVDYRVKRLGLWREHVGKRVTLERK